MRTKPVGNRHYFLTYVLPAVYTDSELTGFKDEVAKIVAKHKGKVVAAEEWGKRHLAYKIRHAGKWHTEGVYVHLTLEVEPVQVNPLEKDVYLNQHIMRHLLVVTDEPEEKSEK